jgi:RNA polymerase sigma factor (TIGR02999 family)
MTDADHGEVTRLLLAWGDGDDVALERLMPLVYAELHTMASRYLRDEHAADTLQTTALIHEAYVRLVGADVAWEGRRHFLTLAARTMRRILVDHARAKGRTKRGGAVMAVTLGDHALEPSMDPLDVLAIDEALEALAALDERKARAVELHYFGGLEYVEVAEVLGVSPVTVHRDLRFARSWIYDRLRPD